MKKLFIDTGAFLAKEIVNDQHHAGAVGFWAELSAGRVALFSSVHVLDETTTLLARRTTYAWATQWAEDALGSGISWLQADPGEWRDAARMMKKFADQAVSYTDCLSFVLMRREGLRDVFAFDGHFAAAGFRLRNRKD